LVSTDYLTARDGDSGVIGDIRAFPVQITTFFGQTTESLMRHYFAWSYEVTAMAKARDTRFVLISDNSLAIRPEPTVRRVVAELIDGGPPEAATLIAATFVVYESALVRGAVTAIQWLSNRNWNLTTVPSVQHGITAALAKLTAEGIALPVGLSAETYRTPTIPDGPQIGPR
jgi:hypothetical protein